ncbi:INVS [Mytilus edulis]|uniref:INVS n=1 Tax=Mytilus edulis TaxID=6550 RepID=A0A8S3SV12_MYTED|nr:INVS [Mytilus edulis]
MENGGMDNVAEIAEQELEGVTQMHVAAVNGDKALLAKQIVSSTQELDTGDQFGRTPLMFCVLADRLDCAELLLRAGTQGNNRLLKLLLSKGADIKQKDNEGQTVLHLCTRHKSTKCMNLLLRQLSPGEIDDQDKKKRTALHWAASYGNVEHVKLLIKQDSNIGIPDIEGKEKKIVQSFEETTPTVINWPDYEGRTSLHLAVADGNESIVKVLISVVNSNISALDNMFRTPLHWAAVLGHSGIVSLLLDNGGDYASQIQTDTVAVFLTYKIVVDEPDVEGRSAFMWVGGKGADDLRHTLHAAALSGHASTVKLLLDHGALIDAPDLLKHTSLFRACEMGHTDVVQTLIDYGARVDVLDHDGRSSLHW